MIGHLVTSFFGRRNEIHQVIQRSCSSLTKGKLKQLQGLEYDPFVLSNNLNTFRHFGFNYCQVRFSHSSLNKLVEDLKKQSPENAYIQKETKKSDASTPKKPAQKQFQYFLSENKPEAQTSDSSTENSNRSNTENTKEGKFATVGGKKINLATLRAKLHEQPPIDPSQLEELTNKLNATKTKQLFLNIGWSVVALTLGFVILDREDVLDEFERTSKKLYDNLESDLRSTWDTEIDVLASSLEKDITAAASSLKLSSKQSQGIIDTIHNSIKLHRQTFAPKDLKIAEEESVAVPSEEGASVQ